MTITEKQGNLFSAPEDFVFAHCISADFALAGGIALQFREKLGTRDELKSLYPDFAWEWKGECLETNRTLNLVTKNHVWGNPTYDTVYEALCDARKVCESRGYQKLAIPRIGCGIDGLEWELVKPMIEQVFADTDVEIVIYCL